MEAFVAESLRIRDLNPPAVSLKNVFAETSSSEPVLIIISQGSDPSEELRDLAHRCRKQLYEVSMGQGQVEVALSNLHSSATEGDWLCLKNLHLMTHWIPSLEKELAALSGDTFCYSSNMVQSVYYFMFFPESINISFLCVFGLEF